MLIIIDKNTKKVITNHGTNSIFPDGNIPNVELKENEESIMIHDDSEEANIIIQAHEYSFDDDKKLVVHKTIEQYRQEYEQSPEYMKKSMLEELKNLDAQFLDARLIEDIINKKPIHQSKFNIISQKEKLRQQLQELEV
jgi:hypothetical protein